MDKIKYFENLLIDLKNLSERELRYKYKWENHFEIEDLFLYEFRRLFKNVGN